MSKAVVRLVDEQAKAWSGIGPPNATAHEWAQGFAAVIKGFEKLRGELKFEDEPSSFEAALQETKERPA